MKGPKGSIYHLIGRDSADNPIYFNNNKFVSFEGGAKKELRSEPSSVRISTMEDYSTKYKWLLDEKAKNINEKLGLRGEVKQYTGNDYFKSRVDWLASQNGTGLMYRVYQQDIDPNLNPHSQVVLDDKSAVKKAWHLNAKDSAIIVLDKRGKVKFVKEGKLSQTDIQAVISLITELTK